MGRQPRGAYSIVTVRVSKASQEPHRGLERGTVDPSEDCVHVPLVPCRRHRSLVGRGIVSGGRSSSQGPFTRRIGVCCFTFYRHRRLYFTVLRRRGVYVSCVYPADDGTYGRIYR